jgi:hypothetical protein
MQPGNQNRRHGLIATLPLAVLLAACGTTAATTTHSSSPTPTPTATTTPAATITPLPVPPLAVLSQGQELKVVNSQGVRQWSLSNAAMEKIFGVSASQAQTQGFGINSQIAGPNIILFYNITTSLTKVAVLSRTGNLVGSSTVPLSPGSFSQIEVSPSGTEWAWIVDQTPYATGKHHGLVEVGGLREAVRTVYHWVAPVGFTETVAAWTNTGIIMFRVQSGGCGVGFHPDFASFVINPTTGSLSDLFSGNENYLGASSGVTVASLGNDEHSVLIDGVKYSESKSSIDGAYISPDGAHVAVSRINLSGGCAGSIPKLTVEMVTVANQSHVDLQNLTADGWWDDDQFIANNLSGSTWIYTLQGNAVSEICSASSGWGFSGVLTG